MAINRQINGAAAPDLGKFFSSGDSFKEIPRLALSLEALEKSGKTHWALMTTPEPIALVTNDPGTMHVFKKAKNAGRKIPWVLEQNIIKGDPSARSKDDVDKDEQKVWRREFDRFTGAMEILHEDKTVRTLVIDNTSEIANLCELAHFGKLKGNARIDLRAEFNAAMHKWFWDLYKRRPDLNMILIHRLKKEYKPKSTGTGDSWTGGYEREGFNRIGYYVDMSVRAGWIKPNAAELGGFWTEVDANQPTRYGAELSGKRWYALDSRDPSHFASLAMAVFPETELEPEYWGL